MTFSIVLPGF